MKKTCSIFHFLAFIILNSFSYSQTDNTKFLKNGDKYRDFSAETMEGEIVNISDSVTGKIAIIHLWSTWCSPCRKKAKEYISVYEKYKKYGFTIIAVANINDTVKYEAAINNDKTPWLNLIDLNEKYKIWDLYSITGGGGVSYLIDENGIIISLSPSAKELDKILSKKYKLK